MSRRRKKTRRRPTPASPQPLSAADVIVLIDWVEAMAHAGVLDNDIAVGVIEAAAEEHVAGCGPCRRNQDRFQRRLGAAIEHGPVTVAADWFEDCDWSFLTNPYAPCTWQVHSDPRRAPR
jgi:hypothetical protein